MQTRLLDIIHSRVIIVGHSLDSDLKALKITHPFIVDTSILYPHPRGPPLKSSLKYLADKYLDRVIQKGHGTSGHNSIEDARATLDLVKMKCEKGPAWGAREISGEMIFKRLSRTPKRGTGAFPAELRDGKTSAVVDHGNPERTHGASATFNIPCKSDTEVVEGIKRATRGDPDGAVIPGGGVDFTFARLNEIGRLRSWHNDNRNDSVAALNPTPDPNTVTLAAAVAKTVGDIVTIKSQLPPCTLFIVYTGTGDPRQLAKMHEMQRTFKREYAVKKWDQLSVKWTDTEEQELKQACRAAREGMSFVCMT